MFLERSQTLPWGEEVKKRKSETHIAKAERRRDRDWKRREQNRQGWGGEHFSVRDRCLLPIRI